eukprot:3244203-Rhodomonas_salina.1
MAGEDGKGRLRPHPCPSNSDRRHRTDKRDTATPPTPPPDSSMTYVSTEHCIASLHQYWTGLRQYRTARSNLLLSTATANWAVILVLALHSLLRTPSSVPTA